jgi:hypothetical protein
LELKVLEKAKKYSCFSASSLLAVRSISVMRSDSAILGILLAANSIFRLQLPFECIDFFKKEGQRNCFGSRFDFRVNFF